MSLAEIIGFTAGGIGMVNGIPQAMKVRSMGHGNGVSAMSWMIIAGGNSAWLGYGLRIASPSMYVTNLLSLVVAASVVVAIAGVGFSVLGRLLLIFASCVLGATLLPASVISVVMIGFTLSRVPQILHSWKSKRDGFAGSAVSMHSLAISITSLLLWEAYSLTIHRPLLVTTTTIAMVSVLLIAWFEFSNNSTDLDSTNQSIS